MYPTTSAQLNFTVFESALHTHTASTHITDYTITVQYSLHTQVKI